MEFINGRDLSDLRLRQENSLFARDTIQMAVQQLCSAFHYARTQKVVHRDLKPSNIMLTMMHTPMGRTRLRHWVHFLIGRRLERN